MKKKHYSRLYADWKNLDIIVIFWNFQSPTSPYSTQLCLHPNCSTKLFCKQTHINILFLFFSFSLLLFHQIHFFLLLSLIFFEVFPIFSRLNKEKKKENPHRSRFKLDFSFVLCNPVAISKIASKF